MVTPLRSEHGHMSVGDSAEQFISFHALGRQRLLVSYCGLPSHPLNTLFFAVARRWRTFVSVFYTPAGERVFKQKPYRHPPLITGCRLTAVHIGEVLAPDELATFRVYDAFVDFVERIVWRTRNNNRLNSGHMLAKIKARNRLCPEF